MFFSFTLIKKRWHDIGDVDDDDDVDIDENRPEYSNNK